MDLIQVEQKANEFVNKGMISEALEQFQIILKKKPNDLRIRKTMADLYVKIDDKGKARRYYLEVAEARVKEGNVKIAIPLFRSLTQLDPKNHEYFFGLGECYEKEKKNEQALECFKKCVELTKRLKPDVAQKYQKRVIHLIPGEMNEKVVLVEIYESAGWSDQVADEYTRLSRLAKKIGKDRESIRFLERAVLAKDDVNSRRNASIAQFEAGNIKRSLELLVPVFKENTSDVQLLEVLAKGLAFISEKERAAGIFNEAARLQKLSGNMEGFYNNLQSAYNLNVLEPTASHKSAEQKLQELQFRMNNVESSLLMPKKHEDAVVFVQCNVMFQYGLYQKVQKSIERHFKSNPDAKDCFGLQVLLIESLCAEQKKDAAIAILQQMQTESFEQKEVVERRLFVLNDDGEEIIDMSEDDFDDDFDDAEPTVANTPTQRDDFDDSEDDSSSVQNFEPSKAETSALKVDDTPKDIDQLLALAKVAKEKGDTDSAIKYLSDILDLDPSHDVATTEIVNLMSGGGSFDDDIDPDNFGFIEEPISAPSTTSSAFFVDSPHLSKAMGFVFLGMFDEARRMCSGTDLGDAVITAMTFLEEGNLRKAKELQNVIDETSSINSVYCEALWVMAKIYARQEKIRSCKKFLSEMSEIDPNYRYDERECLMNALDLLDE